MGRSKAILVLMVLLLLSGCGGTVAKTWWDDVVRLVRNIDPPARPAPSHPSIPIHPRLPIGSAFIGDSITDDVVRIGNNAIKKTEQEYSWTLTAEQQEIVKGYAKCRICEIIKESLKNEGLSIEPSQDLACVSSEARDYVYNILGDQGWLSLGQDLLRLGEELPKVPASTRYAYLRTDLECMRPRP